MCVGCKMRISIKYYTVCSLIFTLHYTSTHSAVIVWSTLWVEDLRRKRTMMMMMKNVFMTCLYFYILFSLPLTLSLFSSFHLTQYYNVLVMFIKSVSHTQVWVDWNVLLSSKLLDNRLMLNSAQLNRGITIRHMHQRKKLLSSRIFLIDMSLLMTIKIK